MIKLALLAAIVFILYKLFAGSPAAPVMSAPLATKETYGATTPMMTGAASDLVGTTTPDYTPDPAVLTGKNFLDARRWTSINTVGNSLKNSSYDIRAAPAVPKNPVGPWQQSDIQPDLLRRPLE